VTGADSWQEHDCIVVLSPHLDDAALSCGSLLARAATFMPVTVMTLFTTSEGRPTLSARAFLNQCNARKAPPLYAQRRAEDRLALRSIGVTGVHFGLPDALFRRRASGYPRIARTLLPELDCVYPTFRLHISQGRVSRWDKRLLGELEKRVLLATTKRDLILAPLGLGNHVDHVLTHQLGKALSRKRTVGWYADQPYALRAGEEVPTPVDAERVEHEVDQVAKARLIAWYGTQVAPLFGNAQVPAMDEYVYLPAR
jgi:LmbE family N-acetylglucosaminyl deacetylase